MASLISEISALAIPAVVSLCGTVITVVFARVSSVAKARWGIEIEARHREALQSALMSGIRSALARGLTGDAAVKVAIGYADVSVPDAIKALKPSGDVLDAIALAKLREALGNG